MVRICFVCELIGYAGCHGVGLFDTSPLYAYLCLISKAKREDLDRLRHELNSHAGLSFGSICKYIFLPSTAACHVPFTNPRHRPCSSGLHPSLNTCMIIMSALFKSFFHNSVCLQKWTIEGLNRCISRSFNLIYFTVFYRDIIRYPPSL